MASTVLLLLARHRAPEPDGKPLGSRRARPHHPAGWDIPRDDTPAPPWPGGRRPPLADNLPKET